MKLLKTHVDQSVSNLLMTSKLEAAGFETIVRLNIEPVNLAAVGS